MSSDAIEGLLSILTVLTMRANNVLSTQNNNDALLSVGPIIFNCRHFEILFVVITWIYHTIDCLLRLTVAGSRKIFFKSNRNKFDFFCCTSLTVMVLIALSTRSLYAGNGQLHPYVSIHAVTIIRTVLQCTFLLRVMSFPRNIACFTSPVNGVSWTSSISTIIKLVFTFLEVMLCITFTYAHLGVSLFGGVTAAEDNNPTLAETQYGKENFYALNFNDIPNALCPFCLNSRK